MNKVMFFGGVLAGVLLISGVHAALTELPDGYMDNWGGKSRYAFVQNGEFLHGVIEYAVYDTQADGYSWIASPGDHRFLYAYQVFSGGSSTAALAYFGLTDFNPDAIDSGDKNLGTDASGGGIDVSFMNVNLSKTLAYYEFEEGLLIQDEKSVILLLGSDYLPTICGYEIEITLRTDDEIIGPGHNDGNSQTPDENGNGSPAPEPATLSLLLGGALLSLRRRKKL